MRAGNPAPADHLGLHGRRVPDRLRAHAGQLRRQPVQQRVRDRRALGSTELRRVRERVRQQSGLREWYMHLPAGHKRCGKRCVDVKVDPNNCGECGNGCPGPGGGELGDSERQPDLLGRRVRLPLLRGLRRLRRQGLQRLRDQHRQRSAPLRRLHHAVRRAAVPAVRPGPVPHEKMRTRTGHLLKTRSSAHRRGPRRPARPQLRADRSAPRRRPRRGPP